jgi:hypothetical protein
MQCKFHILTCGHCLKNCYHSFHTKNVCFFLIAVGKVSGKVKPFFSSVGKQLTLSKLANEGLMVSLLFGL